ncbi:MAG: ABC transporter substrate-binding protein [Chloroflexota bacterium]
MKITPKRQLLLILLLAISACSNQQGAAPFLTEEIDLIPEATAEPTAEDKDVIPIPFTFTDDLGRVIKLTAIPTRIIATAASITDILFSLGADAQVVGRDDYSIYPEAALDVQSIGSFFGGVPVETILALEPDLIIAAEIISAEQVQEMADLGLTVYWQANPSDFEGLFDNITELAELTGHEKDALAVNLSLQTRVNSVESTLVDIAVPVFVFYELDGTDPNNPWTTGSGTFIDFAIAFAGGVNIASELEGDFAQISSEAVIIANPQAIILADAAYGISIDSVAQRAGWESISAVVNNNVHPFDPTLLSVPGTRLVTGLESLATLLHPTLFE